MFSWKTLIYRVRSHELIVNPQLLKQLAVYNYEVLIQLKNYEVNLLKVKKVKKITMNKEQNKPANSNYQK